MSPVLRNTSVISAQLSNLQWSVPTEDKLLVQLLKAPLPQFPVIPVPHCSSTTSQWASCFSGTVEPVMPSSHFLSRWLPAVDFTLTRNYMAANFTVSKSASATCFFMSTLPNLMISVKLFINPPLNTLLLKLWADRRRNHTRTTMVSSKPLWFTSCWFQFELI